MLTLLLTFASMAFFAGVVGLIAKLSGRTYDGGVTCPIGNEVDYDNPFPGWGNHILGLNKYYERVVDGPPAVPFEKWTESRSR